MAANRQANRWESDGESSDDDDDDLPRRKKRCLMLAAAVAVLVDAPTQHSGPRGPKRRQQMCFVWAEHCLRLNASEFRARYRLDYEAFNALLDIVRADIQTENPSMAERSKGWNSQAVVEPEVRLAVTLRYLSGGQVIDLRLIYCISTNECYVSIWRTVDAINKHLSPEDPLSQTGCYGDPEKMATIERDFRAASPDQTNVGNCGAMDGLGIKQRNPGVAVSNPNRYWVERKSAFCILCISICDQLRRFLWWDMSKVPQTHDSMAFKSTRLGQAIANGELTHPRFQPFINADAAFSAGPNLVVPVGDNDFDFYQSSARMPTECCYGILIRRFGIMWRPLAMRFDKRTAVISACMNLHNFCIDRRVEEFRPDLVRKTVVENGKSKVVLMGQVDPGDAGVDARFLRYPAFDKKGRPVDYLDLEPAAAADGGAAAAPAAGAANPTELWRARMKDADLKAPRGRGSS